MASTPLLEAASSSWTSREVPLVISTQEVQTPQGSPSRRSVQLRALARIRAVEVLPGPPGSAEQVGVGHPSVPHGVAQGQHHVVLAQDLGEGGGTESSVQRLVGGVVRCVGHVAASLSVTGAVAVPGAGGPVHRGGPPAGPGVRCDGQVDCGTRPDLLRAAAFRP